MKVLSFAISDRISCFISVENNVIFMIYVCNVFKKIKKILYVMVKNDFFPLGKTLVSCLPRPAASGDNNNRVLPRGKKVLF